MTTALQDPQVRAWLDELRRLTADSPDGPLVVEGVERHVEDVLGAGPVDAARVRAVLEELGDPAVIAAEAAPAASPRAPFLDRRAGAVTTVLVLTFGGVVVPVLGWVVGLVMLWTSRAWTVAEKIVGTVAPFAGALVLGLLGVLVTTLLPGVAVAHLGIALGAALGVVAAALVLLARARTRG